MKIMINSTLCFFLILGNIGYANELARRASWEAKFASYKGIGTQIKALEQDTPLAIAGAKTGDIILSVDASLIESSQDWYDATDSLVAGQNISIKVKRGLKIFNIEAQFNQIKRESYSTLNVEYGHIENDYGVLQRTIVTVPKRPKNTNGFPAIFMLQGLSCSSIEVIKGRTSNYTKLLGLIVENSDMLVMRVEKPGMGDSQGMCSQTDFKQELNGYEIALQTLLADPRVDKSRVIVYGNSMGSAIAPYLANKYQLNGIISDGTFFRTWFEHMLEIERRIKQMQGLTESQINQQINQAYIPLYYGMLIEKRSYADLIRLNPLLAQYNYHGEQHMYGRPMQYYHQLQDFDFAGHWQQVTVPVRIRYGENDWIMSKADNHMIIDSLKQAGNDNAELFIYPKLDHWSTLHDTAKASFEGKPGKWEAKIAQQILDWATTINQKSWR